MKTKHTPGPWSFTAPTGGIFSQRKMVASVYGDDPDCKADARLVANARLVAAAPDLLEAVAQFTDVMNTLASRTCVTVEEAADLLNPIGDFARFAKAKATGEAA